jgi:peptidoglycan/LPS O-acetylase OafA/YrhL
MHKAPRLPADRLYALDVLRGFAALSIVLCHWQYFFYIGKAPQDFDGEHQPLFQFLSLLYTRGSLAVELFFCISGFVFFWLFARKIADDSLPPMRFFIDRFSRLYPLHVLSFILTAGLQFLYARNYSAYFVYQTNDLYHAFLNILLIPAWGFETDWSFNAPIWSVSVEVLLYGIFFLVCRCGRSSLILIPLLIGLGLGVALHPHYFKLGNGIFTFFCGGVAYIALARLIDIFGEKKSLVISAAGAVVAWVYVWINPTLDILIIKGIIFPLSVAALAAIGLVYHGFLKPFAAVGDLSYSAYLLHFPLQIAFVLAVDNMGYEKTLFYSPWMLGLFMSVLIPLSLSSYYLFETPIQQMLRNAYLKRIARGSV